MKQQYITRQARKQRYSHILAGLICSAALILFAAGSVSAQYADWKHSGSMYILTTPEGANLPASALVKDFPLLVRLNGANFDFSAAADDGSDIRFSAAGKPLAYEIDQWDKKVQSASIWVRVPLIKGNARQEIKIHWGKFGVKSGSDGKAVFNASNGYIGVWHLGDEVRDVAGNLDSKDKGTSKAKGMIGGARNFPGGKGVFCGQDVQVLPQGAADHSTQAWFRSDGSNGRIVAWGKEKRQGKVTMMYQSPPGIRMDCYFSSADVRAEIPNRAKGWTHAVHTYEDGQAIMYINGEKRGAGNSRSGKLAIEKPARMWIGGWYNRYGYIGDIDEVRISGVARSADWVQLEYQNQKPMQTLVGPVVQDGSQFRVSPRSVRINEGETVDITAKAGGAQMVSWSVIDGSEESVIATNRFGISYDAGRVSGDSKFKIRFDAVYSGGVKSIEVPVTVKETLPEPNFTLKTQATWDGRKTIEVHPEITNLQAMKKAGVGKLDYKWEVSGLATIKEEKPGKLILTRAQNSGKMTVKLTLTNGGDAVTASADVTVKEPAADAWVRYVPADTEMPLEGQFYARDDTGQGTMYCKGVLKQKADEVFLRVFADDKKYAEEIETLGKGGSYSFAVKLKPALVKYRIELGTMTGGTETVLYKAGDIVCGDAYLIEGQSNALATDIREESPCVTNEWVRSYGQARFFKEGKRENLWCKPVWKSNNKARKEYIAELGWWGMDLANRLVKSQKVPIFILNAAQGGTRIDQHQRNNDDPTDIKTIYGRMLWRLKQARLTHGIRAVIWHQGESDQGAAGPDGGYGWETYHRYFVDMSANWKRDFPNVSKYYTYQIWPNSCSMGGGNGDMMREVQRTLPRLYSNMEVMSTLGIKPPGGCHFPFIGWSKFADYVQPLIERDFYGKKLTGPVTGPNLKQAFYTSAAKNAIALEFDQPITWNDSLVNEFRLDEIKGNVLLGVASKNMLILNLKEPSKASKISYLDEMSWSQDRLLFGKNGIAALTFRNVPILPSKPAELEKKVAGPSKEDAEKYSYQLGYRNGKSIAANPKLNPGDIAAFIRGVKVGFGIEKSRPEDKNDTDCKKGLNIGTQFTRIAKQRFPYFELHKLTEGLSDGLVGNKHLYTDAEVKAAIGACTKFVITPKPKPAKPYLMLNKQAPKWDVGPWHQLPEGKTSLDISDFKGKVLYMYCFQSWCPGCHSRGFPALQKVSKKYKDDDNVKFAVFQTVFEDRADKPVNTFANLKKVAKKFNLKMPFAQSGSREDKSKIMQAYKTRGTPWTIIVDKKGVIRQGNFVIDVAEAAKLIDKLKAE